MTDTRSADSPASDGAIQPSEFEDAFSAFAKGEDPAPASEPAQDEPEANESPEPSTEPEAPAAPQSPAEPEAPAEIDWSTLPPAAKQAYDAAVERAETQRVALSRQGRELHDLRSRPAPEPQPTPPAAEPPKGKLSKEQLDSLREDYPDLAGPLLDYMEDLSSRVAGTTKQVESAKADREVEANFAALDETMPDWKTYGIERADDLSTWLLTQPRYVQDAAKRNETVIVDVTEAADVLTRFKASLGITAAAPAPTPNPTRDRRLAAGQDASTKTPSAASGVPDDFEGAFKSYSAKAEKNKRTF